MTNKELPSLSPELAGRTPDCIGRWLTNLWIEHTGSTRSFETEPAWMSRPNKEYSSYNLHNYEIVLALEFLNKIGRVKNTEEIIQNGQLKGNISEAEWQRFITTAPLQDLKVGVIGGPEARIFAEMGASAVGFDPYLNKLPILKLLKLEEHSVYFSKQLALQYANRFDLTLSSWLFDQGTGLTVQDFGMLTDIIAMTKKDGFSIHNGNLIPTMVKKASLVDKVLKVVPPNNKYKLGDSPVYFVLQKR